MDANYYFLHLGYIRKILSSLAAKQTYNYDNSVHSRSRSQIENEYQPQIQKRHKQQTLI